MHTLFYLFDVRPGLNDLSSSPDAHVFTLYKQFLRPEYEDALVRSRSGEVNIFAFLKILIAAIEHAIQARSWKKAFLQAGSGNQQRDLSCSLKQKLQLEVLPVLQPSLPTFDELAVIYPRNAEPAVDCLFDQFLPTKLRQRVLPESFTWTAPPVDPDNPWKGRLRSSSTLHLNTQPEPESCPVQAAPTASSRAQPSPAATWPSPAARSRSPRRPVLPRGRRLLPPRRRPRSPPAGN